MYIEAYKVVKISKDFKSVEAFKKKHAGYIIESVDGEFTVGDCEVCGKPILDGEKYLCDEDGIRWHKRECLKTQNPDRLEKKKWRTKRRKVLG